MISKKTKYALKALMVLGEEYESQQPILISDLAEKAGVPKKFLELILLDLKNKGILVSRRGKAGGYLLGKRPADVPLGTVLRIFEGPLAPLPCLSYRMGYRQCDECNDLDHCAIRRIMKGWHDAQLAYMEGKTLQDLLDKKKEPVKELHYAI